MYIFIIIISAILGFIVCNFFLGNIFIIIFFSTNFTKELECKGLIYDKNGIAVKSLKQIFFLAIPIAAFSILIYFWLDVPFYLGGILLSILNGYKLWGRTNSNIKDYVRSNRDFINIEGVYDEYSDIYEEVSRSQG